MATFAFKAVDLGGVPARGEIEAADKQTVSSQLRAKGLIVVDIEEQKPANAGDILANFRRVKTTDLTIGTRQLATMVSSGMSLLRALYVIEEQTENDKLREAWGEVRRDVEAGPSLSDALRRHDETFNALDLAMVGAGRGAAGGGGFARPTGSGGARGASTTCTWRWWRRGSAEESSRRPSFAWPISSRRTTRSAARSRRRWSTPR